MRGEIGVTKIFASLEPHQAVEAVLGVYGSFTVIEQSGLSTRINCLCYLDMSLKNDGIRPVKGSRPWIAYFGLR